MAGLPMGFAGNHPSATIATHAGIAAMGRPPDHRAQIPLGWLALDLHLPGGLSLRRPQIAAAAAGSVGGCYRIRRVAPASGSVSRGRSMSLLFCTLPLLLQFAAIVCRWHLTGRHRGPPRRWQIATIGPQPGVAGCVCCCAAHHFELHWETHEFPAIGLGFRCTQRRVRSAAPAIPHAPSRPSHSAPPLGSLYRKRDF